ncbi:hypothetical protein [Streptomyces griseus]|nr:hypothetical protein [Streptomyces griseus]
MYSSSVGHDACQPADTKRVEDICGDAEVDMAGAVAVKGVGVR